MLGLIAVLTGFFLPRPHVGMGIAQDPQHSGDPKHAKNHWFLLFTNETSSRILGGWACVELGFPPETNPSALRLDHLDTIVPLNTNLLPGQSMSCPFDTPKDVATFRVSVRAKMDAGPLWAAISRRVGPALKRLSPGRLQGRLQEWTFEHGLIDGYLWPQFRIWGTNFHSLNPPEGTPPTVVPPFLASTTAAALKQIDPEAAAKAGIINSAR